MIAEQLRSIIRDGPYTPYHIAKVSGVDQSSLSRFLSGKEIRSNQIDKLCVAMGLVLVETGDSPVSRVPMGIRGRRTG